MKAAGWKCISSSIISIIIIALFFIGCGWNKVTRISYTPPSEKMRLTDAPTIPIAVARDFVDNRSGANKDPFLSLMWFVPYASYEYPKCYKKPSGKAMPLSKQMKLVVKKHFRTKGLFRFIAPEKIATKDTYPIFEITGVIRKISCKGGYSFCGLGIVPGLLPLLGLFSYANGGFDVDMTIECRDVLGEFISIK
ncbi:MAG: hypothetical protein JW941_05195, partial [Candidatus Coatesbacteria bacterium]|nr:hypothetical protein [Candidatus Coatesbacteria bacterium]